VKNVLFDKCSLSKAEQEMFPYILLGFAIEVAKKPLSWKSFWGEIYNELGVEESQKDKAYRIIFETLWRKLKDVGIGVVEVVKEKEVAGFSIPKRFRFLVGTLH